MNDIDNELQAQLADSYRVHFRPMPWREDFSPYRVMVSEIMLQQTQVDRVIPKFESFIQQFPDFDSLSRAALEDVYACWQGLGYNRRARWLRDAARIVSNDFESNLPGKRSELEALPGIGHHTAGAILVYAFNQPELFIETNVRTVYIHHYFNDAEQVADKEILPHLERTVDRNNPRKWYWSLMDYGTLLKKTIKDPARKSSGYRKQPAFKGSLRELRGGILRHLSHIGPSNLELLQKTVSGDADRLQKALDGLHRDKMIHEESGVYRLGS